MGKRDATSTNRLLDLLGADGTARNSTVDQLAKIAVHVLDMKYAAVWIRSHDEYFLLGAYNVPDGTLPSDAAADAPKNKLAFFHVDAGKYPNHPMINGEHGSVKTAIAIPLVLPEGDEALVKLGTDEVLTELSLEKRKLVEAFQEVVSDLLEQQIGVVTILEELITMYKS